MITIIIFNLIDIMTDIIISTACATVDCTYIHIGYITKYVTIYYGTRVYKILINYYYNVDGNTIPRACTVHIQTTVDVNYRADYRD